jgi:uncharacterized repeat protein (TIGR03803 family)
VFGNVLFCLFGRACALVIRGGLREIHAKLDERRSKTYFLPQAMQFFPMMEQIMDNAGNLYGTTAQGGSAGFGPVLKLNPTGSSVRFGNRAVNNSCLDRAVKES